MKLRQIKLAGFKTFVDPTNIAINGQLAGIVGPNGCGKSNIMESVKWVLGSASAKELRGESMESVIFNGTDTRPAISRASVELIFDNSENKAPNEWAQYQEISVRRVIEKDKGSNYYINNMNVRRKDVADLFYGTGLGSHGYAIIGQNTISQLVEARPEELKNFLEEAAGISKYKERRKETEYRLRDTRENLKRVQDLEKEIANTILKLEAQAEAARKYKTLSEDLKHNEAVLALAKKFKANEIWQFSQESLKKIEIEVEQKKAELTKAEIDAENTRSNFQEQAEGINIFQAAFYEASSKVSSVETQIESNQNEKERLHNLISSGKKRLEEIDEESKKIDLLVVQFEEELKLKNEAIENYDKTYLTALNQFKNDQTSFNQSLEKFNDNRNKLQESREQLNLDKNTLNFIDTKLQDFENRLQKLKEVLNNLKTEFDALPSEDDSDLTALDSKIDHLNESIFSSDAELDSLQEKLDFQNEEKMSQQSKLSEIQAEIRSINNILESETKKTTLSSWLKGNQIEESNNLKNLVSIDKRWSKALDTAMSFNNNCFYVDGGISYSSTPPIDLTVLKNSKNNIEFKSKKNLQAITDLLKVKNDSAKAAIAEMLYGVYVLENKSQLDDARNNLVAGEVIIDESGNLFGLNYEYLSGEVETKKDTFETKNILKDLSEQEKSIQDNLDKLNQQIQETLENTKNVKNNLSDLQDEKQELVIEKQNIEISKASSKQKFSSLHSRIEEINSEIKNLETNKADILKERDGKKNSVSVLEQESEKLSINLDITEQEKNSAEEILSNSKKIFEDSEKQKREIEYEISLLNSKITDLNERKTLLSNEYNNLIESTQNHNLESFDEKLNDLKNSLQNFIAVKEKAELELRVKRDELSVIENQVREKEQHRMSLQQSITPIVDNLQNARLDEQQKKIEFEYTTREFNNFGIHEANLTEEVEKVNDLNALIDSIDKLKARIERIGPINMAAVSELETEKERQTYISEQVKDLSEASATLESAIGKIDRETREKLNETYKAVNENLNSYFRKLFGGGKAALELLGNEILDTGLQIIAQPPGKKNSTIHLLSGGEKALTAIALVFALFRLNPAPFCLLDEVDAPLDDSNTERFCSLVKEMSDQTQFLFVSHNKITMEISDQLIGVTMQESGVSRIVEVDLNDAREMQTA
ncbi:MAG: chromosome segregation protein SMC [Nitrosomonadales bacterium]